MPLFQGFCPVAGTICPSLAAAVVGPSRAPQGMKKGRRPRRRPRLKLSDKAGPDQCPVPGENALFPAQIAGFLAVSRAVPVYPVFLNYVVPVQLSKSAFLISPLRPTGCPKWGWASARNCGRRIAGCDSCPTLVGTISLSILSRGFLKDSEIAEGDGSIWPPPSSFSSVKQRFSC